MPPDTPQQIGAYKGAITTIRGNRRTAFAQYKNIQDQLRAKLWNPDGTRNKDAYNQLKVNNATFYGRPTRYWRSQGAGNPDPGVVNSKTRASGDGTNLAGVYNSAGLRRTNRSLYGYGAGYGMPRQR